MLIAKLAVKSYLETALTAKICLQTGRVVELMASGALIVALVTAVRVLAIVG